jgi:hypothetical protein
VHVHPIQFKLYDGFVPQCLLQVYRFWDVYPIRLGVIDQFVISFCLSFVLLWLTASDYLLGIFKLLAIVLSVLLWLTSSDLPFGIFKLLLLALLVTFKLYDGFVPQCLLQVYRFWDVYPIRLGVIDQFVISFVEIP